MTRRWSWRGEERDQTRPPRRIGEALSELAGQLRIDDPILLGRLSAHWVQAVGDAVAGHAQPRALEQNLLVVEADSPEWATQIRFLEREVLEGIAGVVGPGAVTGLRVVIRRE